MSEHRSVADVLVDKHLSISDTHAQDMLKTLAGEGLEIRRVDTLDDDQRARVEAVRIARVTLARPTGTFTGAVLPADALGDLVSLARFILTGSEFEDDVRLAAAEDRATREASDGHVCQPVPTREPDRAGPGAAPRDDAAEPW